MNQWLSIPYEQAEEPDMRYRKVVLSNKNENVSPNMLGGYEGRNKLFDIQPRRKRIKYLKEGFIDYVQVPNNSEEYALVRIDANSDKFNKIKSKPDVKTVPKGKVKRAFNNRNDTEKTFEEINKRLG